MKNKMNKKYFKVILMIFMMLLIIFAIIIFYSKNKSFVILGDEKIFVEIADSNTERHRGLMYKKDLCDNCGMLFVFEKEEIHKFWMKNTYIPLDIVFINSELKVVDIIPTVPCEEDVCNNYVSKEKTLYVLEVNYGKFDNKVVGKNIRISF